MRSFTMTALYLGISMLAAILTYTPFAQANSLPAVIDTFDHQANNNLGLPRQFLNDSMSGGGTTTEQVTKEGVLHIQGDISPARGQPGWASTVLLLHPQGLGSDASAYTGIRLKVKIIAGNMSVSANSTLVTNFDYHAAAVSVPADKQFHTVDIPFASMKPAWSPHTNLDTKTLSGLSIVAFDLQKGKFNFEIDEVGFY